VAKVLTADTERGVTLLFLFVINKLPVPTLLQVQLRSVYVVAARGMSC